MRRHLRSLFCFALLPAVGLALAGCDAAPVNDGTGSLVIEDLLPGSGRRAEADLIVTLDFVARLENGFVFDTSLKPGRAPLSFALDTGEIVGDPLRRPVIEGLRMGVEGMHVGGRRRLTIPPDLAFGSQGSGDTVPANANVIYEVDLLDVRQP